MLTEEIILVVEQEPAIEDWFKSKLERFREYHPNYWIMGNINDGVFQVNLYGYSTPSLPITKLNQIFKDTSRAICYFADAKCIYQPMEVKPENTSIVVSLDSGIKVPITGMFVIGGDDNESITGMDLDAILKVFSQIQVNPDYEMFSLMEV